MQKKEIPPEQKRIGRKVVDYWEQEEQLKDSQRLLLWMDHSKMVAAVGDL